MRHVPVLKNGVDVGLSGLVRGDLVIIELTHFLPIGQDLMEAVLAYSLFCFKELVQTSSGVFLLGGGYHFNEDDTGDDPTRVCTINCRCIRRISIFDFSDPINGIAKVIFNLMKRNEELAQENAKLSSQNAQLIASHFNNLFPTIN